MGDFRKLRVVGLLPGVRRVLAGLSMMVALGVADAALTDVSDAPFYNSTSSQLKPNIMLLMDTSNSMRFSHMPDQIEGTNSGLMPIGYKSYQCNVLYYNPNRVYEIPKDSSGSALPTPSFTAAPYNYFSTDASTRNLSASFQAYDTSTRQYQTVSDPEQAAYYYLHSVAGTKNYLNTPCTDADVGATVPAGDGGTWTRVLVSSTSGPGGVDERQNFANWYTFYRTRISLIKSAVSLAFMPLTDSSRVGFITVNPDLSGSANYLPIADFNATQRSNWFNTLFSQVPGGSSPSREGLARVGRHFAGKQDGINSGMSGDPIQFSCQQNFTIMTTDGYWNVAAETAGPVMIDGATQVGQQDGTLDIVVDNTHWTQRPMWDGGADTLRVITDKTTQYRSVICVSPYANQTTSQTLQSTSQNLQSTTQNLQSTAQNLQSTLQNLKSTSQLTKSTSQITQSTLQNLQSTSQKLKSTSQLTRSTSQLTQSTSQNLKSTVQKFRSTSQLTRSTSQLTQSTSQNTQSTLQNLRSTSQVTKSTSQATQSTSQLTQSTLQNLQSTSQPTRSTSQITVSTLKAYQSTSQILQYDATTELTTPVASCTPGGNISCTTVTRPDPGGFVHARGGCSRQPLYGNDLLLFDHRADRRGFVYACQCFRGQWLHHHHLQHRDHRANARGQLHASGCRCRQQLYDHHLQHRDHRTHAGVHLYAGDRCGWQRLYDGDLFVRDHRAYRRGLVYASGRFFRQQLYGHDLQHRDYRTHRRGVVYAGGRVCRQQLHGDDLQHRDHRTHRRGVVYACGRFFRQQLYGDDLQHRDHRAHCRRVVYARERFFRQ